ncbi:pentatricopeptide repeat-containing protein At3g29230-like [Tasmannia lanceolata]|uniref:pentatricopeptide repeat-containing protein At3g29230-like n=1 Tax=Tasmannia lanceolata TaxID=3420 RepID=UPI004063A520
MSFYVEQKISFLLENCTFKQLKQIHGLLITSSLNQNIQIYSKFHRRSTEFGTMEYSEQLFSSDDGILQPEIFLWNNMIRGYAYNGPYEKCIYMFDKMPQRDIIPNAYTYPFVLKVCLNLKNLIVGIKIHCQVLKSGFEDVSSIANSLLNFYIGIGKMDEARKVFDGMIDKPIELWNRMISEYVDTGELEYARRVFDEIPKRDLVSWNSMISGYSKVGDIENARYLFKRMPEKNVISWTSMIRAFANSGDLTTARKLFDEMPERNIISWNSMISHYSRHGKFREALDLFVQMQLEGPTPDGYAFTSVLNACSHLGALNIGQWIHFYLIKDGFQIGEIVGTSIIEMYAKCGDIDRAFKVFIKMVKKDVFCWNVMIKSLAIHGRIEDAIRIFLMMQKKGFKPNDFTFSSTLFACSHGGMVEDGRRIFNSMKRDFGIDPKIEHYGCLIDLLSRNGQLEEAEVLAREMPFEPDIAVWGALLGGCRVRNDFKLAEKVMEKISELRSNESGVYVLLSNIYASAGRWPEALSAREKMEDEGIWKRTGCSSVLGIDEVGS